VIAISVQIGHVYIAPDGTPCDTRRIGERRDGVLVSTPVLSDREIDELGLTGVKRGDKDANRLYGASAT
jgi:hypothetical protein